jgi:5-methylcytosine-specific restriction endonuclease McrA
MNRRTIGFVKSVLRKASLKHPARLAAKNKAKVDKALYACQDSKCKKMIYEGYSAKNYKALQQKYPNSVIKRGKIQLDHIDPVVPIEGFSTWDEYIERLFCEEDNFRALCEGCHGKKSRKENKQRKKAA